MTRGGRRKDRDGPERRCVATGESGPTEGLIRFALSPDGVVTPDLAERLPGRGVWVTARRDLLAKTAKKGLFARGFKAPAQAPDGLPDAVEAALAQRLIEAVALARKAGLATNGFEKVKARLKQGRVGALLEASDGSAQGRAKLAPLASGAPVVDALTAEELGLAFGRDFVIHAVLDAGGATDRVVREGLRLAGFRRESAPGVRRSTAGPGLDDAAGTAHAVPRAPAVPNSGAPDDERPDDERPEARPARRQNDGGATSATQDGDHAEGAGRDAGPRQARPMKDGS
jgi:predicted RNA-binding protein YlxR (DUF448 family)